VVYRVQQRIAKLGNKVSEKTMEKRKKKEE